MEGTKSKLSAELVEKARKELNEDQAKVPDQIKSLREKILEDPNLNFQTDDAFLLKFLRARKFDEDRTLELMTNYYKQRVNYPHVFNQTTADLEKTMNSHCVYAVEERDEKGRAVILITIERWNPNEWNLDQFLHAILMILEYLSEDEAVQINGCVLISDLEGLSLTQITHLTPWKLKEVATVLFNSFPMRHQGIYHVNESPMFDSVFAIIKPFLSKKLQERITFHGNCYASLHELVNPEILPEELGGDVDSPNYDLCTERVVKHAQIVMENHSSYGFVDPDTVRTVQEEEHDKGV